MSNQNRRIILASRSPRRKKLLEQIGLDFEIRESKYEEDMDIKKDPYVLAKFLALKKTEDVAQYYDDAIVIGADTFVIDKGKFIGKPKNAENAKEILKSFSGREHEVVTGFAVIDTKNDIVVNDFGEAKVKFRDLSDEEIENYVNTGEPLDMAGGYCLTGRAIVLVKGTSGDFYSIIGLPLDKIYLALKKMGVDVLKR